MFWTVCARDREADAGRRAALIRQPGGQRRDPHDLIVEVHQGAAAVARVDGGAGLNRRGDQRLAAVALAGADGAAGRRDDALRDAVGEAQRVAHGQHDLADLGIGRVREPGRLQIAGVAGHPDHGEIVGRELADDRRVQGVIADCFLHRHGLRVADHVLVGDDVAVGVVDHAGAGRVRRADLHDRGQHRADDLLVLLLQLRGGVAAGCRIGRWCCSRWSTRRRRQRRRSPAAGIRARVSYLTNA